MADGLTTPFPNGTKVATKDLGTAGHVQGARMLDDAGAEQIGVVGTNPGANTVLGRMKALADGQASTIGYIDTLETLVAAVKAAAEAIMPSSDVFPITPHATNAISPVPRVVRVESGGTVTYRAENSSADVTETYPAGSFINAKVKYIRVTGTTASGFTGYA